MIYSWNYRFREQYTSNCFANKIYHTLLVSFNNKTNCFLPKTLYLYLPLLFKVVGVVNLHTSKKLVTPFFKIRRIRPDILKQEGTLFWNPKWWCHILWNRISPILVYSGLIMSSACCIFWPENGYFVTRLLKKKTTMQIDGLLWFEPRTSQSKSGQFKSLIKRPS